MIVLPATLMVRAPAGAFSDPFLPTAAMRLSVTSTSPDGMTSSPFIVMMRAPVSSTEPLARDRGSVDGDVGLLRLVGVDRLLEELRAPRPRDRFAVGRPLQVVAAFGRHALDRHDALSPRPVMRMSTVSRPAIGTVTRKCWPCRLTNARVPSGERRISSR